MCDSSAVLGGRKLGCTGMALHKLYQGPDVGSPKPSISCCADGSSWVSVEGSTLSLEDLRTYKAQVSSALNITLNNHTKVFAPGPPMGGAVLMFILKVLEGKFLMEKGQQETFREGCSRVIKCNGRKWRF